MLILMDTQGVHLGLVPDISSEVLRISSTRSRVSLPGSTTSQGRPETRIYFPNPLNVKHDTNAASQVDSMISKSSGVN